MRTDVSPERFFLGLQSVYCIPGTPPAYTLPESVDTEKIHTLLKEAGYEFQRNFALEGRMDFYDTYNTALLNFDRHLFYDHAWKQWTLEDHTNGATTCPAEPAEGFGPEISGVTAGITGGYGLYPWLHVRYNGELLITGVSEDKTVALYAGSVEYSLPEEKNPKPPRQRRILRILGGYGSPKEREIIGTLLRSVIGLRPVNPDLFTNGLSLFKVPIPGVPVEKMLTLSGTPSFTELCSNIFIVQAFRIWSNVAGVINGGDVEYVHDMRVAVRRLRTLLKSMGAVFGSEHTEPAREALSWLGDLLGKVRDGDVLYLSALDYLENSQKSHIANDLVMNQLRTVFIPHRRRLVAALKSSRFKLTMNLIGGLNAFISGIAYQQEDSIPVARMLIREQVGKIAQWADIPVTEMTPEQIHRIRIDFKRLRYHCEFFMDLFDRSMKKSVKTMIEFQDCLGDYNDAVFALETIETIIHTFKTRKKRPVEVFLVLGGFAQYQRRKYAKSLAVFKREWCNVREILEKLSASL